VNLAGTGPLYKLRLQLLPLSETSTEASSWSVSRVQLTQSTNAPKDNVDISLADDRSSSKLLSVNGDGDLQDSSCLELATRPELATIEYRVQLDTSAAQTAGYKGRIGVCLVGGRGDSGRRSFCGLQLDPGQTLTLQLNAVDLGRLTRCHVSVDLDSADSANADPWHCDHVTVAWEQPADGGGSVQFGVNEQQPELRRSRSKLDYILRPMGMEHKVDDLVKQAINLAVEELQREEEEPELAHIAEDPSEEPTAPEEEEIDDLAKEAKFLVEDIADQVAKRMEGIHEEYDWQLRVSTGETGCSADSEIFVQVYGATGKSENLRIKSQTEKLQLHPQCDADLPLKLKAAELGELYKLRLSTSDDRDEHEWFVKQVILEHRTAPHEKFTCPVDQWFGRRRGPLHEVAHELPLSEKLSVLSYTVEIENAHTVPSGGSRPYVQLLGTRGDSGYRRLHRPPKDAKGHADVEQTPSPLSPDAVDSFRIDCVDLDRLVAVQVGLENPQPDDAWLFDSVRISVPQRPDLGVQVFNNSSAELGPDVASVELLPDGAQSTAAATPELLNQQQQQQEAEARQLDERQASGKQPSQWDWIVTLRIALDSGPKQTGRVFLALYGDSGHSRDVCLNAESSGNDDGKNRQQAQQELTPGSECEFRLVTEPLGRLWKLRLSVHHQDTWDNFCVSGIRICRQILEEAGDEAEKQQHDVELGVKLGRTSDAVLAKEVSLEADRTIKQYEVAMQVAQRFGAATDTEFFVDISGSGGNTGRRFLLHDRDRSLWFSEADLRRFLIEAVDLGSLSTVFVGHDKPGRAGVGCCFDWISVREASAETKMIFPCGRWFESAFDQVSVERELTAHESVHVSEAEFNFFGGQVVLTLCIAADSEHYKGPVHVTAIGAKGQSGPLTQPGVDLPPGRLAEFATDFGQGTTGRVQQLRIELGRSASLDATLSGVCIREAGNWLASAISTNNPAIRRWTALEFGAASEAGAVCHDVPLDRGLRVVDYVIGVRTAAKAGGSEPRPPKIFTVEIQGRHGNTGPRPLGPRALLRDDFGHRPGGMDTFLVTAVYVGPPLRLTIALDVSDSSNATADDAAAEVPDAVSWPIDAVLLREGQFNPYEFRFEVGGGVAKLTPNSASLQLRDAQRVPATGDLAGLAEFPRTTGRFNVVLHVGSVGWSGQSKDCRLRLSASGTTVQTGTHPQELLPAAERGLASYSIGELTRLRLDLSGSPEARLEVTKIRLSDAGSSAEFFLPVNRVLASGESVELAANRPGVPQPRTLAYQVSLRLGKARNSAGSGDLTANSLALTLHGDLGESGSMPLPPSHQPLTPGQTIHARLNCLSVGQLSGLTIGHDCPGRGQGVYIDHATVSYSDPTVVTVYFPARRWLDAGWGDGFTQATLSQPSDDAAACSESDWLLEIQTDTTAEDSEAASAALMSAASAGRLQVRLHPKVGADGRAFVTEIGKATKDGEEDEPADESSDHDEADESNPPMLLTPLAADSTAEHTADQQQQTTRRCLFTFKRRVDADSDDDVGSLTLILQPPFDRSIRVAAVSLAESRYSRWCVKFRPTPEGQSSPLSSAELIEQLRLTASSPTETAVEKFQPVAESSERSAVTFGQWRLETWSSAAADDAGAKLPPGWIEFVSSGDVSSGRLPLTGLSGNGREEFLVSFDPVTVHEVFKVRLGLEEATETSGGGVWKFDRIRLQDRDTMDTFASAQQHQQSLTPGDCIEVQADWPGSRLLDTVEYEVALKVGAGANSGTAGGVFVNLRGTVAGEENTSNGPGYGGSTAAAGKGLATGQEVVRRFRSLRLLPSVGRVSLRCDATGPGNGVFVERLTVRLVSGDDNKKLTFPVHRGLDEGDEDNRLTIELFPATAASTAGAK
uniref:PLAT domain-containing protein n=1 Tax=Macrostomum lignano TaxID=282301 RepID=A0A1I8GA88_9PLAT